MLDGLDIGDEKRRLLDEFTDRWPWETVERTYAVRRLVSLTPARYRDDVRQVAAIAAWRAVESWDPEQRSLVGWCHFKGHYAALDALRALYRDEPPAEPGAEQVATDGDPDGQSLLRLLYDVGRQPTRFRSFAKRYAALAAQNPINQSSLFETETIRPRDALRRAIEANQ